MSDHSSADSEDLTVEDQNNRNSETDDIQNILGQFMGAGEESLEELVGGFMFLTMDDVRKAKTQTRPPASTVRLLELPRGDNGGAKEEDAETRVAFPDRLNSADIPGNGSFVDADGIEEEVLEEGGAVSGTDGEVLFRHRPASLTKFDNFVESAEDCNSDAEGSPGGGGGSGEVDGEEMDDWLPTSGYSASFSKDAYQTGEKPVSSLFPAKLSSAATEATTTTTSPEPHAATSKPAFSSGDNTASGPSAAESEPLSLSTEDDASAVCESELESQPPPWSVNPGEVEGEEEETSAAPPVKPTLSVMDFSVIVAPLAETDGNDGSSGSENRQECSDEVQAFALEDDFDYDNVVYTPKFSRAEMGYLASFVPAKN